MRLDVDQAQCFRARVRAQGASDLADRDLEVRKLVAQLGRDRLEDSAAMRHRNAIGMDTVSLSTTLTVNPSTDEAPTRAASAVAESCAPM